MRILSFNALEGIPEELDEAGGGRWCPPMPGWAAVAQSVGLPDSRDIWLNQEQRFSEYGCSRHFVALVGEGRPASLSAFVNRRLQADGEIATFGMIQAEPGQIDVLGRLAAEAEEWCRHQGARRLRGPIPYSTWYPSRFVLHGGGHPAFPGEPTSPAWQAGVFRERGYEPSHRYISSISEPLADLLPKLEPALQLAERRGTRLEVVPAGPSVQPLFPDLFRVSLSAFRKAYSFSPIDFPEFADLYRPALGVPDALLIVARDGEDRFAGFAFGFGAPQLTDRFEGGGKVAVLKTVAVDGEVAGPMAGAALAAALHREFAQREGYTRIVHALMSTELHAQGESSGSVELLRQYAILERAL